MNEQKIEDIIEDCVSIRMKDIPEHMIGIDLTWLDKEIRRIKDRLFNAFAQGSRIANNQVKGGTEYEEK